ncbi:hypothetical protein GOBAR_DD03654 [Gossypium barbadense]|nr:hypothetical protein GOBAR_DD03654 [Gossypium barbadense]
MQSLARINQKDSWLFWWTLYLNAVAWTIFGIFSLVRLEVDYLLVVGVCLSLAIANIIGFTKCRKGEERIGDPRLEPRSMMPTNNFTTLTVASSARSNFRSYTYRLGANLPLAMTLVALCVVPSPYRFSVLHYWNVLVDYFAYTTLIDSLYAKNKIQAFASRTIASRFSSTLQSAFSLV